MYMELLYIISLFFWYTGRWGIITQRAVDEGHQGGKDWGICSKAEGREGMWQVKYAYIEPEYISI